MRELGGVSELAWLEGVGHMPNLESPEGIDAALVRFLARLAPTGAAA